MHWHAYLPLNGNDYCTENLNLALSQLRRPEGPLAASPISSPRPGLATTPERPGVRVPRDFICGRVSRHASLSLRVDGGSIFRANRGDTELPQQLLLPLRGCRWSQDVDHLESAILPRRSSFAHTTRRARKVLAKLLQASLSRYTKPHGRSNDAQDKHRGPHRRPNDHSRTTSPPASLIAALSRRIRPRAPGRRRSGRGCPRASL